METIRSIHNRLQSIVPLDKRSKMFCYALVTLGACMDNFNVSGSMATAYSQVQMFNTDTTTVSWSLSAYALTLGAFIMLGGKLSDILGPDVVFITSLFITGLFALISALIDDSIIAVIVIRALQGVTAAFTIPSSFAIAGNWFQGPQLGRALMMIMVSYTGILGVAYVVGGAFSLTSIGYKGIYYVTFAVNTIVSFSVYLLHTPIELPKENKDMKLKHLDFGGSALFVIGTLLIILGLTEGGNSWSRPSAYVPLPIGVLVLTGAFVFELVFVQGYKNKVNAARELTLINEIKKDEVETTLEIPEMNSYWYNLHMIIPREMLYLTNFYPFVTGALFMFIHFIMVQSSLSQYHQYLEGNTPLISGLKILPMSVGLVSSALFNLEKLWYRIGMKWVIFFTQFASVFLLLWISRQQLDTKNGFWIYEFAPLFLYGVCINVFYGLYINAMLRNTPVHLQGVVSGFLQTLLQLSICLGNALTATVLGEITIVKNGTPEQKALGNKFDICFYICIACCAVSTLAVLFIKNQKSVSAEEDASVAESLSDEASV